MNSICLDIGGTSIKGGYFSNNNLLDTFSIPSNGKLGREEILKSIDFIMKEIIKKYPTFDYIGISSAGNIDYKNGICVYASNNLKGWTNFNIKEYFTNKYHKLVFTENDAVCALIGEIYPTYLKNSIFMITLGTGVGACLYKDKKIYLGNDFDLGKFAHHIIKDNGNLCDCGNKGCAEKEISATGLKVIISKVYKKEISIIELFNLFRNKDLLAKKVLDEYFYYLKKYLDYIINDIKVDHIIIGGGLINSKDVFELYLNSYKDIIIYAVNGNNAGIIGANLLINREVL